MHEWLIIRQFYNFKLCMYRHANGQGSMTPNEEGIWL